MGHLPLLPPRGTLALCALILGIVAGPAPAEAFCRTTTCGGAPGERCEPATTDDCGVFLSWPSGCMGFAVQQNGSVQVDFPTTELLMSAAFAAWTSVDCGGGATPSLRVDNLGPVACDQQEFNQQAGNVNVVVYREGVWPYEGQGNTLGLTTVTYNLDNGAIFDADLEVNATDAITLTVGDDPVVYDLPSILIHEAGHMLGIAHTREETGCDLIGEEDPLAAECPTMTTVYVPTDTKLRTLSTDDVDAICSAYPPGRDVSACSSEPRRGLKTTCGDVPDPEDDGCGCELVGAPRDPSHHAWWLAGVALVWRRRRTR